MTPKQKQTASCTLIKTKNDAGGGRPSFAGAQRAMHNRRLNLQLQGWLFLLPAVVLLATFTHVPAVSTVIDSLFSTPQGRRPAAYIGLDQYDTMLADPIFWRALDNNLLYALITVPVAIGLALVMALFVN